MDGYLQNMIEQLKRFRAYLPAVLQKTTEGSHSSLAIVSQSASTPRARTISVTLTSPRANSQRFAQSASQASSMTSQNAQQQYGSARQKQLYRGSTQSLLGQHSLQSSSQAISPSRPPRGCIVFTHGYSLRQASVLIVRLPVVYPNPGSLQVDALAPRCMAPSLRPSLPRSPMSPLFLVRVDY